MNAKIKHIPGIGPVRFVSSTRAKRINISIRIDEGVRITVPRGLSFKRAETYLQSKHDWIIKHQTKLQNAPTVTLLQTPAPLDMMAAKLAITERVKELADQYGFSYNRITIRNQKTRWGSCSHVNNLSLNIRLISLPPTLMDYVILHELVHTRIKNHGPGFWSELDYYVKGAKKLDKQLKKYKITNQKETNK